MKDPVPSPKTDPVPSPKTKQPSTSTHLPSTCEANTSYFLIRRSSRRTPSDNGSSDMTSSIGSSRIISPRVATTTPSITTGNATPSAIDSAFSDWNYSTTRTSNVTDPPRPPRDSYEWVWFPEGYWAERYVPQTKLKTRSIRSKLFNSSETSGSEPEQKLQTRPEKRRQSTGGAVSPQRGSAATTRSNTTSSTRKSSFSTKSSQRLKLGNTTSRLTYMPKQLSYLSPTYPHFVSPDGIPEGLYCKTRRNLGIQAKEETFADASSVMSGPSVTGSVLAGASSYLKRVKREKHKDQDSQSISEDDRSLRKIGLAPWHRHDSTVSSMSASSSIRGFIMGRTPPPTPFQPFKYTSKSGKEYKQVEISNPHQPNFLPSEAKKIETPVEEPILGRPSGGFYPGFSTPGEEVEETPRPQSESKSKFRSSPLSQAHFEARNRRDDRNVNLEDWRLQVAKEGEDSQTSKKTPTVFEINVLEHLPSSSLCPSNSKHQSEGSGICPFHGRRKSP